MIDNLIRLEESTQLMQSELNINRHRALLENVRKKLEAFEIEVEFNKAKDALRSQQYREFRDIMNKKCRELMGRLPRERRPP